MDCSSSKKPKPNCAQGKSNEEAYSGYGLIKHLQSQEVSGTMSPGQVHRNQWRIQESLCSSHSHHGLLQDIMITGWLRKKTKTHQDSDLKIKINERRTQTFQKAMELAMHFIFLFSCSFTANSKQTASTMLLVQPWVRYLPRKSRC